MPEADCANKVDKSDLASEFDAELRAIADWWLSYSLDQEQGGFYGEVAVDNRPVPKADKGVVLNARILWFFSELASHVDDRRYTQAAARAYNYFCRHFIDAEQGGVFWALDCRGEPIDTKKQVYAQAFAIYALTAYYQLSGEHDALELAINIFHLVEKHTVDRQWGGYREAFERDWGELEDVRLSAKDLNFPKSQNTHLHVLEAYTTLHEVAPNAEIKTALRSCISLFEDHIVDQKNHHLRMFMASDWRDHSPGYTYGHDIESSWLLAKAVESLGEPQVSARLKPTIIAIADVCLADAMGEQGEVLDGYDFATKRQHRERVWWVQAEALVGFLKVYALTNEKKYRAAAENVWEFIKRYQIDAGGEWLWFSNLDAQPTPAPYKLGFWKGPYHNGRAMIEAGKLMAFSDKANTNIEK